MRVLVACEESQEVCKAFRALGHEAYSCDIQECSGGHPEWHIRGDVLPLLKEKWDLIIAHPPCTYLSNAGACRLYPHKGQLDKDRYIKGLKGKEFFMAFWWYGYYGGKIVIENPVPSRVYELPKQTNVIQPWEHGEPFTKKTYLWEFGVPHLMPSKIVEPIGPYICGNSDIWKKQAAKGFVYGKEKSAKHRSKTFPGIAKAMAEQWGGDVRKG